MPARKQLTFWILRSLFMFAAAAYFIVAPFQQGVDERGGRASAVLIAAIGLVIFNFECWTWWRRSAEWKKERAG